MTEKKLNILFLASWYPNTESTQAGNFIQQHAKAVLAYVNVAVIHVVAKEHIKEEEINIDNKDGITEVIVYYPKVTNSAPILSLKQKKKKHHQAYLIAYKIALDKFQSFDLVHLNVVYPAGLFALYLKEQFNIPYILTEHWTAFLASSKHSFNTIEKHFIKKIAHNAALICPVSENLKHNLVKFGIDNDFKVVPNVADTTIFKPKTTTNTAQINILHVSNLKEQHKNITGILRVIQQLSEKRQDFKLTIAGNGDISFYQDMAKQMNINNHMIQFEGEKTPQEVAALMQQSDLFLLFSNYENLPCVIIESLVVGIPVLSTNVGGIAEMVNESNGKLIKAGNEEELKAALTELLDTLNQYNHENISKEAVLKYSSAAVGKSFFEIYQQVLNK